VEALSQLGTKIRILGWHPKIWSGSIALIIQRWYTMEKIWQ
jgi:hypothetical protein